MTGAAALTSSSNLGWFFISYLRWTQSLISSRSISSVLKEEKIISSFKKILFFKYDLAQILTGLASRASSRLFISLALLVGGRYTSSCLKKLSISSKLSFKAIRGEFLGPKCPRRVLWRSPKNTPSRSSAASNPKDKRVVSLLRALSISVTIFFWLFGLNEISVLLASICRNLLTLKQDTIN